MGQNNSSKKFFGGITWDPEYMSEVSKRLKELKYVA